MNTRILAIGGSLRKDSYNRRLLEEARRAAPDGVTVDIADLSDVPFYDGDVEATGLPASVVGLAEQVAQADALLIATPEYNYSIPGVLKNAIDWLSRVPTKPIQGKPVGLASASMGGLGGSRAQYHLRQVLVVLDPVVLNRPEVFVSAVHEKFTPEGELSDPTVRAGLVALMQALAEKADQLALLAVERQAA